MVNGIVRLMILPIALFMGINSCLFGQIPEKRTELARGLPALWRNVSETPVATQWAVKLFEIEGQYHTSLDRLFHDSLAYKINSGQSCPGELAFLESFFRNGNPEMKKYCGPIYYWSKIATSTNNDSVSYHVGQFNTFFGDSANRFIKTERYGLLILQALERKNYRNATLTDALFARIKSNTSSCSFLNSEVAVKDIQTRAWNRFILSYCFHLEYVKDSLRGESLRLAAKYSPDRIDRTWASSYTTDFHLLNGNRDVIGYEFEYFDYLVKQNRNEEALKFITNKAVDEPSDLAFGKLKLFYKTHYPNESFADYWFNSITAISNPVPDTTIKFRDNTILDFSAKRDNWILIDAWATWCKPCVHELPEIDSFYRENKANSKSNLEFYSFSNNSQNLDSFLLINNYHFPVAEINSATAHLFGIELYPTKVLILPNRRYITVPYGPKWKEYVRNYCMLEE